MEDDVQVEGRIVEKPNLAAAEKMKKVTDPLTTAKSVKLHYLTWTPSRKRKCEEDDDLPKQRPGSQSRKKAAPQRKNCQPITAFLTMKKDARSYLREQDCPSKEKDGMAPPVGIFGGLYRT